MERGVVKERYRVWAVALVAAALISGCGSRPGFDEDFTQMPPPEGPGKTLTDEEIEEAKLREKEERLMRLEELRQEELDLYLESDEEFDAREAFPEYRLAPGDDFNVRFASQPEMNIALTVRPDGMVSFDLVGDVPVSGMAPEELARTLEEMYAVYLRDPQINVVVKDFVNLHVYVLGEVLKPGEYPLRSPTSLAQAVAMAGSWSDDARLEDVMVIRMRDDQTPFAFKVNMKEVMKGAVHADPYLRNMDIVYVPMGKIASTRNFVGRFFQTILPPIDAIWKTSIIMDYARN
jgi:protein involved in polysaccharide export with SLBB domain